MDTSGRRSVQIEVADFNIGCELHVVDGPAPMIRATVETVDESIDTWLVRFRIEHEDGTPFVLQQVCLRWEAPVTDMHGFYAGPPSPQELSSLPFWWRTQQIGANKGVPFQALLHRNGNNQAAFGLIDQLTETEMSSDLSELTRSLSLFLEQAAGWQHNHD